MLDGLETIEICTGYRIGDRTVTEFPSDLNTCGPITPIYESWPGWTTPTKGAHDYAQLPAEAQQYIRRLEEVSGVPVGLISTGSDRHETIIRGDSVVAKWLPHALVYFSTFLCFFAKPSTPGASVPKSMPAR